jgi:hypothetical protein
MKYANVKEWRDMLAKIATEKLPDYIVKSSERYENEIEILLSKQDATETSFIKIEIEPVGKLKYDRIRIYVGYRPYRDYKTDEQFERNIAKIVAEVRVERNKAEEEEKAREAERKIKEERRLALEKIADAEARFAFSNNEIEQFTVTGDYRGGKVYINFPKIKDEIGFAWPRCLELEYEANNENKLTWTIGKDMRIIIPDLSAFAKVIL